MDNRKGRLNPTILRYRVDILNPVQYIDPGHCTYPIYYL